MVAVEHVLTSVRVTDGFTPEPGHALDLQHALPGLSYCDGFVTDDGNLWENSRIVIQKMRIAVQLARRVMGITFPAA